MDFSSVQPSRNFVDRTNYLTDQNMGGVDPEFLRLLLQSYSSNAPSGVLMQKKYQDQHHNYDPAYEAFLRSVIQKYGPVREGTPFDSFQFREKE